MTGTNDGTQTTPAATPEADQRTAILTDMAEALQGFGNRTEVADKPEEVKAEKAEPEATKAEEPAKATPTPEKPPAKPIDFDVFPADVRDTVQRLHKGEAVEPEARDKALRALASSHFRQADYTKKTTDLAREREELAKAREADKENLEVLRTILNDPRKLKAFQAAMNATGDEPAADVDPLDSKAMLERQRQVAREVVEAEREAERKAQEEHDGKLASLKATAQGVYATVKDSLSVAEMETILRELGEEYVTDKVNPLEAPQTEVRRALRFKVAARIAEKQSAELQQQLNGKSLREARGAKASSEPVPKPSSDSRTYTPDLAGRTRKTLDELGIRDKSDWDAQVLIGNRNPR